MKKWLVVGTLALSMSCINSSYATDPITAAGIAAAAAEGAAVAEGAAAAAGIGTLVGTSALVGSGVGAVAVAAGAGSAKVINDQFFEDEKCSDTEKVACDRAKTGSYVGAGVGVLGSLGALWGCGVSTAGLASIGAMLGGGAIVGGTALIAAPVVAAGAVGWGTYAWYTRDADDDAGANENGTDETDNQDNNADKKNPSDEDKPELTETTEEKGTK